MANQHSIVPDHVLENLVCNQCLKYLTVGPIELHPKWGIICGRCTSQSACSSIFKFAGSIDWSVVEANIPLTLLGYSSYPSTLFPCVNKFEGCGVLLPYSYIRHHELVCIYQEYECPSCDFKGVGSQLLQHFKIFHKRYLCRARPYIVINVRTDYNETFLYRADNLLFLVKVCYVKDTNLFSIDTRCWKLPFTVNLSIEFSLDYPFDNIRSDRLFILRTNNLTLSTDTNVSVNFRMLDESFIGVSQLYCKYNIILHE